MSDADSNAGGGPLARFGLTRPELRAWALIGMSVFLGMRYGIWNKDMTPGEVADLAIDFVTEGLRKR